MAKSTAAALILIVLLLTLPFLSKPVHIDDTFVLHVADSIQKDPLDPFGGEIDWFGHRWEVWKATTNPPFLSYYLALVGLIIGWNELVLHLFMLPFYIVFALATFFLADRFCHWPWLATLFLVGSSTFLVSGNLMRDIPAAALVTGGIALFVFGVDRASQRLCALAGLLIGIAVLTKYSAAVMVPALAVYGLLNRRYTVLAWLFLPVALLGGWCAHTWLVYGRAHPFYLLLERSSSSGIGSIDKMFGAVAILGSAVLLAPVSVWHWCKSRRKTTVWMAIVLSALTVVWSLFYYDPSYDLEFLLWVSLGVMLLVGATQSVLKSRRNPDSLFLIVWLAAPLLFSIFLAPFQAVRHLIAALPPLIFLLIRLLPSEAKDGSWVGPLLCLPLVLQLAGAILIQSADYAYADTYRDFARQVTESPLASEQIWFVGHWGWKFYAQRSGYRQMSRDGPYPVTGDILLWPRKVHIGDVFANSDLENRLELISTLIYNSSIPIRTMSNDAKAGFYAVVRQRIPFRFNSHSPLEIMRIYRVRSPGSD